LNSRLYLAAWRLAPRLPEPLLRGLVNLVADLAWFRHGKGVRRLESNYARVRPELSAQQIRTLSRRGMRSYLRYFREAFTLPGVSADQLAARVRVIGAEYVYQGLADFGSPVAALGHAGNWDLAGAWAAIHLVPVLTVAEKLKPAEVYQAFVEFRRGLGIDVLGLGDAGVFTDLVAGARRGGKLIPLLADRDLTHRGVEVDLLGQRARVAAGPAAVALAAQVPLLLATIHYEKLPKARRRAAGSPWGIVITFTQIYSPSNQSRSSVEEPSQKGVSKPRLSSINPAASSPDGVSVTKLTQTWVSKFGEFLQQHTEDWHMLQAVFIDDLDADKYAETLRRAAVDQG